MEALSIKIKIIDRMYPVKVQPEDETFVRQANKMLEERIRNYQKKLRIQDQQDLLAMVAFDCLVENFKIKKQDISQADMLMQKIDAWREAMEQILQGEPSK
ncbi:cell division protein ZapA [Candidatus Cardinium hertigii]|jgi:cell division protein ZapA|uniref:Cell division protein ZapA n=2 Tax=Candidatus Cardinium hertigii TaxID=247481 RepID=A0A3N2QBA0_9BACT|nr:cell division protein ZapA [Candidatus Cardinium hertigii]